MSYLISFILVVVVNWIGEFTMLFIIPIIYKNKIVYYFLRFFYSFLLSFISVYLIFILFQKIDMPISILMVVFPMLLILSYDWSRIQKVKSGKSALSIKLKDEGRENDYNQHKEIWFEYSCFYGHLTGFINSIFILLLGKSFF